MPAAPQPFALAESDLEFAADQAIEACGGDAGQAVKPLLVAVDFLEAKVDEKGAVSNGYARGRSTRSQGVAIDVTYYVALPFVMAETVSRLAKRWSA